jgi:hypothetical protein
MKARRRPSIRAMEPGKISCWGMLLDTEKEREK